MVAPHKRSRTLRRIKVTTPGGKRIVQYKRRNPGKPHCSACHKILAGVPHKRPYKVRRLPKTSRRPERPYGGTLCGPCMRKLMTMKALAKATE